MTIVHVVGARPNFMKVAPVMAAFEQLGISQRLIHTGQHYDQNMSDVFFRQLGLPMPDINLEVGSSSHAQQTAKIMMRFEQAILAERPNWVLVYGDVNSTVAATLVCAKLSIPVGHVEAGLRSFDRQMPEEINRLMTDQLADLLFTPSSDGDANLLREGISPEKIHMVGNVMIDTLLRLLPKAQALWKDLPAPLNSIVQTPYALVTLHRPSNVDDPNILTQIMTVLAEISETLPIIFPIHPRTGQRLGHLSLTLPNTLHQIAPLGYLEFLALQSHAKVVITDSGGIQEETTFLGIPCFTLRENTERPVTISLGTNTLIGHDFERLRLDVSQLLAGQGKQGQIPPLWDGKAGERIAKIITTR